MTFPAPSGNNVLDEINYDGWVNNLQNIRLDLFLSDNNKNLGQQTEIFVDDNYHSLVDDVPDIKRDIKTDIILEDVLDADTIYFTSDIDFVKKVPQHPRDRLKRNMKRKKIKQGKNKNKKSKQKTNIQRVIKNVFDDFQNKKPVIKIKDEFTEVDFDDYEKPKIKNEVKDVIFEDVEPKFIKKVIKTIKN